MMSSQPREDNSSRVSVALAFNVSPDRRRTLRAYYFDCAPELIDYLASVPPSQRLAMQGLRGGYWQGFRTIAGMVGVVTAVLTGAAAGMLAAIAAGHSGIAGFVTGGVVGVAILAALAWFQRSAWEQVRQAQLFGDEPGGSAAG